MDPINATPERKAEPARLSAGSRGHQLCRRLVLAFLWLAFAASIEGTAQAGPPFLTDDPQPVDFQHWEAYLFSTLNKAHDGSTLQTPAMEINYGLLPDLQAHLVTPMTLSLPTGGSRQYGLGDAEFGLKYRFIQEKDNVPMVGIFPMIEVPTGDADRGLGNGRPWARLPLWIQKSWGKWTTYGGCGYAYNTTPGQRSNLFGGWLVQRQITDKLILGSEIFAHGPDHDGGRATALYNVGGFYNFTENFQLLFTVGHSLTGDTGLIAYVGLYWTWGPKEK
ncbi:MAG: transporter [Planctomycetota bacterium]|nr:transporter [Planctomycetota bacterium]